MPEHSSTPPGEYWWAGDLNDRNLEAKIYAAGFLTYQAIEGFLRSTDNYNLRQLQRSDNGIPAIWFDEAETGTLKNAIVQWRDKKARSAITAYSSEKAVVDKGSIEKNITAPAELPVYSAALERG